jgi:hypothetical protein
VAAVRREVRLEGGAEPVVRPVGGGVRDRGGALLADGAAGQVVLVRGVVDRAPRLVGGAGGRAGGAGGQDAVRGVEPAAGALSRVVLQGAAGGRGQPLVLRLGELVEYV